MFKIPLATWIANAAAVLTGAYGDVTRQAERSQCSRQTIYDRAQKAGVALDDARDGGPTRAELIDEIQRLRHENAQSWDWLAETIDFPTSKQREFAVTACAMGLSLNQVRVLLGLIQGERDAPGRSTIHRWIEAAGLAAGRVLNSLDARCMVLVVVGCLDEIFFRGRPVLVGVEPASMTWFLERLSLDLHTSRTWRSLTLVSTSVSISTFPASHKALRRADPEPGGRHNKARGMNPWDGGNSVNPMREAIDSASRRRTLGARNAARHRHDCELLGRGE